MDFSQLKNGQNGGQNRDLRKTAFSVGLSVLLVGAAFFGAVGTVSAQPASYQKTWTGSPGQVVVDVGSYSGQINLEFNAPYLNEPLWAGTLSGEQIDSGRIRLTNQGAYEEVSVTVTGPPSEPTWDSGGVQVGGASYSVGSTGNDRDTKCGPLEKVDSGTGFETVIDCTGYPGITSINTTGTDANQTEIDLYQDGLDQKAQIDSTSTLYQNYLQDTKVRARIIGQNAYVRSLNNGSSEASARVDSKEAVRDYYAVKQINLAKDFETKATKLEYMQGVAENESGIDDRFVRAENIDQGTDGGAPNYGQFEIRTVENSLTLTNQSQQSFTVLYAYGYGGGVDQSVYDSYIRPDKKIEQGDQKIYGVDVLAPNSNYDRLTILEATEYAKIWNDIENQSQTVTADMDTLVNGTYSEYQSGDINNTDLIDSYTLASRSPNESYQGWAAARLASIGVNSPSNYENTGAFEINVSGGPEYTGILFITEDISVETGQTYDSAALNGTEYVVSGNETIELQGNWTVEKITQSDGTVVNKTVYEDTTYKSSNVSELIEQYERLNEERAQIESRELALISNSGVPEGESETDRMQYLLLVGAAGAAALIFLRVN